MNKNGPVRISKQRGFTLIELLTVVVIIAVLAGALVMNYTGSNTPRTLNTEAERFMMLVELARQKSTLQNQTWGVNVNRDYYEFLMLTEQGDWFRVEDVPFQPRSLAAEYSLHVRLLGENAPNAGPSDRIADIVIYPSGEVSPFELTLTHVRMDLPRYVINEGIRRTVVSESPYRAVDLNARG